jgi:hypothetical protein
MTGSGVAVCFKRGVSTAALLDDAGKAPGQEGNRADHHLNLAPQGWSNCRLFPLQSSMFVVSATTQGSLADSGT